MAFFVYSAEIAKNLIYESCFGLVFGINTFAGLIIQSLLIVIVISDAGFGLDIREQYIAWAVYYSLLAIISFVSWVTCNLISHFKSRNGSDIVT